MSYAVNVRTPARLWIEMIRHAYFLQVLAVKFLDQLVQAVGVGLDADGRENALDVFSRGRGVAAEAEEEICCEVLHGGDRAVISVRDSGLRRDPACQTYGEWVGEDGCSNKRVNRFNRH